MSKLTEVRRLEAKSPELDKIPTTLTVDFIEEVAPKEVDEGPKELSYKEMAKRDNLFFIEGRRMGPSRGKMELDNNPSKARKEKADGWKYVKGMFENSEMIGSSISFTYSLFREDPDFMWTIPVNTPVYLPKFLAKHLANSFKTHIFKYIPKDQREWRPDCFEDNFRPIKTEYRGRFRPLAEF